MHPTELGRYRIVKPLGRGGMGVVYEAHDPRIDRPVAIKTIALSGLDARETAVFEARFEAEMRFAGRLQHQHIAALYDTGRDGDTAYIVMELVRGQDLRRLLAAGRRFSPAEALAIVGQLLAALDYAHRRQVIHRDVKPANVMLQDDGLVKLCDFGVARPADAEATRTQGVMVGSLHYASPEQIAGLPIDIRTDIFSAGALLFELLTGERPFKGGSDAEVLNRIANAEAPSCRSLVPELSPEVDAAIRRALAKRPADRFASTELFAEALGVPAFSSAGGTGSLAFRALPPADPTRTQGASTAAAPPPSASGLRPVWIGGAGVVLAGLAWLLAGRSPADPAAGAVDVPMVAASAASLPVVLATAAPAEAAASAALTASAVSSASAASPVTATVAASAPITVATAAASASRASVAPPAVSVQLPAAVSKPPPAVPSAGESSAVRTMAPAPAPAKIQTAAPSPAPAPGARRTAESATATRPAQGSWQARITCGPVLSSVAARSAEGFSTVFTIDVDWPRLSWRRDTAASSASVSGSFDETGQFQAQGQGARKDRIEIWLERAEGRYLPASRSIVGQVRLLRPKDGSVARECQLAATVGTTPPAPAAMASGPAATLGSAAKSAAAGGGTAAAPPPVAEAPSASPARAAAVAPPRVSAPVGSERAAATLPQGYWDGELACSASLRPDTPAAGAKPFVAPVAVTVTGDKVRFTRDTPVVGEVVEGSIDAAGRFSASGTGRYRQQRGSWKVQVAGDVQRQPARLQGRFLLLRSDDGSLARECSIRARPR